MHTMRDVINLLNVVDNIGKQFEASVLKTFRAKLAETHNVKRSAIATMKQHHCTLDDVVCIVREAKEKIKEEMPTVTMPNTPVATASTSSMPASSTSTPSSSSSIPNAEDLATTLNQVPT